MHRLFSLFLVLLLRGVASAAVLPGGFAEDTVATGLSAPTALAFAPDGRLFVAQQGGALRVVQNDATLSQPFLTVTVHSAGERGLLGVAVDPGFVANRFVYVYYTATTPTIHNRVSRFTANGNVAAAGSEVVLMELETLSSATNHNGGALHIHPDGRLFVAVGDNANGANAQTLGNRLGKLLRIARDGSIPTDNPFYQTATGVNRAIFALGLRNPYTFAIQPGTERIFVNDVGQNTWEEINDGIAGANYGWPTTEGPTTDPRFLSPFHAYGHGGGACAVSGGAFYDATRGTYPSGYANDYFFADFCGGWIQRIDASGGNAASFATGVPQPVDLTTGPDGNLYVLARGAGTVTRVRHCNGSPPAISGISPTSGSPGTMVLASGGGFAAGARIEFGVLPASAQPLGADLTATVPSLPEGPVSVRVVNPNGCRSNPVPFSVLPSVSCGLLGAEGLVAVGLAVGARALARRRSRAGRG